MGEPERIEVPTATQASTSNDSTGGNDGAGFTALLLVGGAGTRLRSVVADRAKPLADVAGEPFVARVLRQLQRAGCRRAVLCSGHFDAQFVAAFGSSFDGMPLLHSPEPRPLGTAGALRLALPHVDGDAVLVLNGDSYCDVSLAEFVAFARRCAPKAALLATQVHDAGRYGRLQLDGDGRIAAFAEKTDDGAPGLINAGIYWLPRAALEELPADGVVSLERQVLPQLVQHGMRAFVTPAAFLDIGVPDDYARAAQFFAQLGHARQDGVAAQLTGEHRSVPLAVAAPRRKLLVVDRDGTLIVERHYLADPNGVELLPGVVAGLRSFQANGYQIAIVSNQSGVGRGYFGIEAMQAVNDELRRQLALHGVAIDRVFCCPHHPSDRCLCRKPQPQLLDTALAAAGAEPADCLVVGDKHCDVELGRRRGARTALVRTGYGRDTELERSCEPDFVVDDLEQLATLETRR